MTTQVEGPFEVTSWSENPADGLSGAAKVTLAHIGQRFTGGVEADTVADLVMTYRDDGTADFVGYQRVQAQLGPRSGSFVLKVDGAYDGTEARSRFDVVPGSGTGDFAAVRGSGSSAAPHGSTGTYRLDLDW